MELVDRNVVITGAGSGIGAALARRFVAEAPRSLVLADINREGVNAVAVPVPGGLVWVAGFAGRFEAGRLPEVAALLERLTCG